VFGRDAEQSVLRDVLSRAAAGQGGVVFITGEPGIGKSRLVRELADDARRRGALTMTGRAVGPADRVDHLIAAVQQHASGSHGHDVTREHILSELQPASARWRGYPAGEATGPWAR
jgi:ABC-type Mn2+/Zn2+ transport system ATPase subunit